MIIFETDFQLFLYKPISLDYFKRLYYLELEPRLNIKTDLTGQAKLSIFQRSQPLKLASRSIPY